MKRLLLVLCLLLTSCVAKQETGLQDYDPELWPKAPIESPPERPMNLYRAPPEVTQDYITNINLYLQYLYSHVKEVNDFARENDYYFPLTVNLCRKYQNTDLDMKRIDFDLSPRAKTPEQISRELARGIGDSKEYMSEYKTKVDKRYNEHVESCIY